MRRLATTFVLVFAAWLALTFSLEPGEVFAGLAVSLLITLICRHLLSRDTPRIVLHPVRWLWLLVYMGVMLYAEVLAHLDVAGRVFTGRVRPAIVEVPVEFRSLLGKTLFGNSITLTPGTLTVNTGNEKRFYIHALAYRGAGRKDMDMGRIFKRFGRRVIS
jgi:multicomponent Na+:H+ antiporter subunit E